MHLEKTLDVFYTVGFANGFVGFESRTTKQ